MFVIPGDLTAFATIDEAKAEAMIEDAEAQAVMAAPCLTEVEFQGNAALYAGAKSVIRQAVLRWIEAGSGVVTTRTAGPFGEGVDTRQERRGMFWPSELSQLRELCVTFTNSGERKAFAVDTAPAVTESSLANYPAYWFQWVQPVPDNAP